MNAADVQRVSRELQLVRSNDLSSILFHGLSLHPFLQDGDRVVVETVSWDDIQVGDLITYRFEDKYPTRRVVAKGRRALVLWCDNWPLRRFTAGRDQVLGRAVARVRWGVRLAHQDPEWQAITRRAIRRYHRLLPLQWLQLSKGKLVRLLRGRP